MTADTISDAVLSVPPEAAQPAPAAGPEAPASPSETPAAQAPVVIETPQSEGEHGRMLLEAQTVRQLVPLRVRRAGSIEQLIPGEACPQEELVWVCEHQWWESGHLWCRVSLVHATGKAPIWWGTKHTAKCQRWMRAFKHIIQAAREKDQKNKELLVGSKGKTRRY